MPLALGMAWVLGQAASEQMERRKAGSAVNFEPPSSRFPRPRQTVVNNNAIMIMGLVGDLDGMAIAYASGADRLVANGRFRLDLSLEQMAELLGIRPESISDPRSPRHVDPNAELFRAQAGTLTQHAKKRSRIFRERQVRSGQRPSGVHGQWLITHYSFTLNRLKHPNDDEKIVLSAIVRAAAEIMPMPGDGVRAVPVDRMEFDTGRISLASGMLPLEPLQYVAEGPGNSP
jgi:hypothetical protein